MESNQTNLNILSSWREELNSYWDEMLTFEKVDNLEWILRRLSAYAARAGFMYSKTVRSANKQVSDFRTKEIDKFLSAVELQFKIYSRVESVRKSEWEMVK